MCLDNFLQSPETAHDAFPGDKERRMDLAVGIVYHHDQIPPLIRDPLMHGAILVQHHADHQTTGPFAPMDSAARRELNPAMAL